ncbi:multiple coagulation factor deficiency protein 2 homolog [Tachypleus tridentatus]|uniref:multiple coagulation factor deficiency protein 2 homolog n=1 Tax=Tachypleus tridentatus TaxID=6853 RepID=UPI003FD165FA
MELRLVPLWTVIISSSLPMVMLREPRHNGHVPDLLDKGSSSILHDERHIRADLYNYFGVSMDETLTNSEIGVYFFQLHDLDKDNRLDGLEILAAINHVADNVYDPSDDENEASHPATYFVQQKWNTKFANDAVVIDKILQENDLNKDGFLIYSEYALARQRT